MKPPNVLPPGKLIAVLSLLVSLLLPVASAVAEDRISDTLEKRIAKLLGRGMCDQFWRELWKDARTGNKTALETLAKSSFAGVNPPSYFPANRETQAQYVKDNVLALMLYARDSFSEELRKGGMISDDLMGVYYERGVADKIRSVNKCFKSKNGLDTCYNLAIKSKLIPTFEEYVVFIDNAPRPAFCSPDADKRPPQATAEELGLGIGKK
jgi:hypothetical protein